MYIIWVIISLYTSLTNDKLLRRRNIFLDLQMVPKENRGKLDRRSYLSC